MTRKIKDIENVISKFNKAEKIYFKNLKPSMLEVGLSCVYAIINTDNNEVLYVGKTTNLQQRLYYNHFQGNFTTARLKKYIVEDNVRFKNITTAQ